MRHEWSPEELIESWTLLRQDWTLVGNKSGATRLGFALLLSSSRSRPGSHATLMSFRPRR